MVRILVLAKASNRPWPYSCMCMRAQKKNHVLYVFLSECDLSMGKIIFWFPSTHGSQHPPGKQRIYVQNVHNTRYRVSMNIQVLCGPTATKYRCACKGTPTVNLRRVVCLCRPRKRNIDAKRPVKLVAVHSFARPEEGDDVRPPSNTDGRAG